VISPEVSEGHGQSHGKYANLPPHPYVSTTTLSFLCLTPTTDLSAVQSTAQRGGPRSAPRLSNRQNRLVTEAVESGLYTTTRLRKNPAIGTGGFYFLRKAEPKGHDIHNDHEHILPVRKEEEEEDSPRAMSVMALLAIASEPV